MPLRSPGTGPDINALCDKLNEVDNDWIRGVREEVAKERLKSAQEAEAGK